MTLDEAIKHCLDIADGQDKCAEISVSEHAKERISQCAADHRQLAEWLTELKEAKRLLKMAVSIINNSFPEVGSCWGCANHDEAKDECKGGAFAECSEVCKWEHADEALALIGEDTNVPASADDINVGHKSGGWISVNDRLPEAVEEDVNGKIAFSKSVLVYLVYDNGFTYITNDRFRVDSKSWLHEIPGEGCKVTHWMPLPEPPKDGDTNG